MLVVGGGSARAHGHAGWYLLAGLPSCEAYSTGEGLLRGGDLSWLWDGSSGRPLAALAVHCTQGANRTVAVIWEERLALQLIAGGHGKGR
jgi:hypothetical protein